MAKKKNETAGETMRRIVEQLSQPDDPEYKLAKDKQEAMKKLYRGQANWTDLVRIALADRDERHRNGLLVSLLTSHIGEEYGNRYPDLNWVVPNSSTIPHVLLAKQSWRPISPDTKPIKYYSGLFVFLDPDTPEECCEALKNEGYYVFVAGDIDEDENFEKAKKVIDKYLTGYIEPML